MRLQLLTIWDVEFIAYRVAAKTMSWNEPIPSFGTRYHDVLERCIGQPFQTFDGRQLYPGLIKKTAILFYLMVKNHPFQNGNKRLAIVTLLWFLFLNKKWIKADNDKLYKLAKLVASSNPKHKEAILKAIELFLDYYLVSV